MSWKGKFSKIIFNTEPFLSILKMIIIKKSKNIKMKTEKIIIGKSEVGIDPKFIIMFMKYELIKIEKKIKLLIMICLLNL